MYSSPQQYQRVTRRRNQGIPDTQQANNAQYSSLVNEDFTSISIDDDPSGKSKANFAVPGPSFVDYLSPYKAYQAVASNLPAVLPDQSQSGTGSTLPKSSSFNQILGDFLSHIDSQSASTSESRASTPSIGLTAEDLKDFVMPCQDRTNEFKTTTKSLHMKVQANGHLSGHSRSAALVEESMQFNRAARKIGFDLSNTCAKLEKLSHLSKRKSIFDERDSEIDELAVIIKQDISALNRQIAQLQGLNNARRTASAKSQAQAHSRTVVVSLQSKLASVSNGFKEVLETRTESLKRQKQRETSFGQQPAPSAPSVPPMQGNLLLLEDEERASASAAGLSEDDSLRRRNNQQQLYAPQNDAYVQSRANAMQNIESTVVELGTIFQQLATMVHEQGEMVQRIDSNVEESSLNIEAAHSELLKYFRGVSQNRWLAMKVFGVLIVFFVIFIVFMT